MLWWTWKDMLYAGLIVFVTVVIMWSGIHYARQETGEKQRLAKRIELLEKQVGSLQIKITKMKASTPKIEVQRATIYTGEGEVIVEPRRNINQ